MRSLCILMVGGCVEVGAVPPALRVEPAAIELTVEAGTPTSLPLHVWLGDREVTAQATFGLDGAPLGTVTGGTLTSDGLTGGAAPV